MPTGIAHQRTVLFVMGGLMSAYTFTLVVTNMKSQAPGFWLYKNKREITNLVMAKTGPDTWRGVIDAEQGQIIGIVLDVKVRDGGTALIAIKPPATPKYYPISQTPMPADSNGVISVAFGHKLK